LNQTVTPPGKKTGPKSASSKATKKNKNLLCKRKNLNLCNILFAEQIKLNVVSAKIKKKGLVKSPGSY
jgi:hypothetical protein